MPTPAKTAVKPRLSNLDDLFLISGDKEHGFEVSGPPIEALQPPIHTEYGVATFDQMDDYPDHMFSLYTAQRKEDMICSIKKNGILQPLILRAKDDGRYTILAGHNRKYNGIDAGLDSAPVIIKYNLTDAEAKMYVIETNLMQRGFADMLPSEKAAVLDAYHSELFSQGKRNDIFEEIKMLQKASDTNENSTSAEFSRSSGTRKDLAVEYGLASNRVALYLRIHQLIKPLKERLDKGEFSLSSAANLSFLTPAEQKSVDKQIELNGFKVDIKKTVIMREYSVAKKLDYEKAYCILNGEIGKPPKKNRTPTVKVAKSVYSLYFKPEQSAKEVQEVVAKALGYYFSHLNSQERQSNAPYVAPSADMGYHTPYNDEGLNDLEP